MRGSSIRPVHLDFTRKNAEHNQEPGKKTQTHLFLLALFCSRPESSLCEAILLPPPLLLCDGIKAETTGHGRNVMLLLRCAPRTALEARSARLDVRMGHHWGVIGSRVGVGGGGGEIVWRGRHHVVGRGRAFLRPNERVIRIARWTGG